MSTAGSIRCHDAGPTGGVLLLNLLRIFWALGEHKAKARHLLALVFLFFALFSCARVSLRGEMLFFSVGQRTGGQAG